MANDSDPKKMVVEVKQEKGVVDQVISGVGCWIAVVVLVVVVGSILC